MHFEGRFIKEDDKEDEKGDGKEKLRDSPASEEFALLYVQDTTNSENFKAHIFLSKKKEEYFLLYYKFCFYYLTNTRQSIIKNRYE